MISSKELDRENDASGSNKTDSKKEEEEKEYQNRIKEIYSVKFSEDEFIQIFEYENSNDSYAEIYYRVFAGYSGDSSVRYVLKITDESNNSLLLSSNEEFVDGSVQSVKIKK